LDELFYFYKKNKTFKKLRNCGEKSNKELLEILIKYPDFSVTDYNDDNPNDEKIPRLSKFQRDIVNSFIYINTERLSVRSKNALSLILNDNFKVNHIVEKILTQKEFNAQDIKNVGRKSLIEIETYISKIKDFIFKIHSTKDEKSLISLKNKYFIQESFNINIIPDEILESDSIFKTVQFLLNQNALFDKTQTLIIKLGLKLFKNQDKINLETIADECGLTRERVRQIRKSCLENLSEKLKFISNFSYDFFHKYNIDTDSIHLELNDEIFDEINQINKTNFSNEFITYILSVYFNDKFTLVGNYYDVLQINYFNSRNRHNWSNFYMIEKKIKSEFDFDLFANDISTRLNDKIEESYSFNFKSFLSKFLISDNLNTLDLIFQTCEKIINQEFDVYLDLNENLIFKRNTLKKTYEYAFEALDRLGKPSKTSLITQKVKELFPGYDTNEEKIRASLKRKNGFVPIGRSSTFGLKKWEGEIDNFKGGTIKEIITQQLESHDTPVHVRLIVKEVNKYREKTNQKNIISNLKLDNTNSFIIYNQNFIGLTSKRNHYDEKKYNNLPVQLGKYIIRKHKEGFSINEIKSHCKKLWDLKNQEIELIIDNLNYFKKPKVNHKKNSHGKITADGYKNNLTVLVEFISENQRIPNSRVPEERNLYQFYYRKKKEINNIATLNPNLLELKELIEKFSRSNKLFMLNNLIEFLSENQRMPSSRVPEESKLYQFYWRIKKASEKNKLSSNEKIKFIQVLKKIQRIKNGN